MLWYAGNIFVISIVVKLSLFSCFYSMVAKQRKENKQKNMYNIET